MSRSADQAGAAADTAPLPLTGADCFLRAFDGEIGRTAGAGHLSQMVVRVGEGFDREAFGRLVAAMAEANPIVRAPIRRNHGIGVPVYRLDRAAPAPGVAICDHPADSPRGPHIDNESALGPLPRVFFERLNDRFDARGGRLLAIDIVPRGGTQPGYDIALTWVHMLLDGSGSERFLEYLAHWSGDGAQPATVPAARDAVIPITRAPNNASSPAAANLPAAAGERGQMAKKWQHMQEQMAKRPPTSLAGPLRRVRQDLAYDVMRLEGADADTATERARKMAGFLTPMLFYLAVSLRAHQAVADLRGKQPASWIVPLPVNLRPKGGEGEVFRTHVSLLWFQVTPEETRDLGELLTVLKKQRLESIRGGLVEAGVAAMDFARRVPSRFYAHMARRGFGGELASFFFAYTAEFAEDAVGLSGAPILDGFHAPPSPASPGSCLAFCLRGDGLNVIHVHQQDAINAKELACLRASIVADLLGSEDSNS